MPALTWSLALLLGFGWAIGVWLWSLLLGLVKRG